VTRPPRNGKWAGKAEKGNEDCGCFASRRQSRRWAQNEHGQARGPNNAFPTRGCEPLPRTAQAEQALLLEQIHPHPTLLLTPPIFPQKVRTPASNTLSCGRQDKRTNPVPTSAHSYVVYTLGTEAVAFWGRRFLVPTS